MKTNLNAETADSPHTGQGPRPRIAALTDLVFGLALSIGAISLISKQPANAPDLYLAIAGFGFSFLILIQIWFRFTEIMSILPLETTGTRVLNTLLLFLVALEPYLFNNLGFFFITGQIPGPLGDVASTVYAMAIGSIYGILAMFTKIRATEEKKLVAPDLLKKYKFSRNLEIAVAVIFLFSAIPEFWILNLRYFFWATTFFAFRGGGILRGWWKRSHSS